MLTPEQWYEIIPNDVNDWQGSYLHTNSCFVKVPEEGWYLEIHVDGEYQARKATDVEVALFQLGGVVPDE